VCKNLIMLHNQVREEHAELMEAFAIFSALRAKVEDFYNRAGARLIAGRTGPPQVMAIQPCKLIESEVGLRLERIKARVYESAGSMPRAGSEQRRPDLEGDLDDDQEQSPDVWMKLCEDAQSAGQRDGQALLRAFSYVEVEEDDEFASLD